MGAARFLVSPARVFARPTADRIWLGPAQQSALSQFSGAHKVRLLVGPPSSGKSTLVSHFASQLPPAASAVLHCRGPKDNATAVLMGLLLSADLAPWELSEIERRNLLTVFIHQRLSQGRRVVLIVDDAHTFKDAAWGELERLLAFKLDKRPALELLLAGPASLAERLNIADDGSNRVCVHRLPTPTLEDLAGYMQWRLAKFEMQDLLTPVATQMIGRLSAGRYAAVNVLCQMSLLMLRSLGLERVDARVVRQAAAALTERRATNVDSKAAPSNDAALDVPPQGYLLISRGGKVLDRVTLGQRTLLGRSEHNDVCLPSPYLSRHHAVIVGTPEGYYAVDLNSVNGLFVNGEQVARAVLCDQDILTLGPFRMKVQIPEWIAHGSPLPDHESLAETAVMPPQEPQKSSSVRRVK